MYSTRQGSFEAPKVIDIDFFANSVNAYPREKVKSVNKMVAKRKNALIFY